LCFLSANGIPLHLSLCLDDSVTDGNTIYRHVISLSSFLGV
jgi:hypothetical protein